MECMVNDILVMNLGRLSTDFGRRDTEAVQPGGFSVMSVFLCLLEGVPPGVNCLLIGRLEIRLGVNEIDCIAEIHCYVQNDRGSHVHGVQD